MLESNERELPRAAALGHLYRQHYLQLVRLAVQLVDDPASAEDVVQDVFARLHRGRQDLDALVDPRRYLISAVLNQARSVLRHRRIVRLNRSDDHQLAAPADTDVLHSATSELMWRAISRLPGRQRQVLVLRYYEDWSIPEIAAALGITRGAASSSLARALKSLTTPLGVLNADH